MSRDVRIAERVYRLFLRAFPPTFRRRMGPDMVEAFRDGCYAARTRRGFIGLATHTARGALELLDQGLRQRAADRLPSVPRSPRRGTMIDRIVNDLRYSLRALRRAPAFTAVAVVTLALGIGATTAIFSVVNGVLLHPLPFDDADELVVFTTRFKDRAGITVSEPELIDLETVTSSFTSVAGVDRGTVTVGGTVQPERVQIGRLTAAALPLLRVEPAIGRGFSAAEDTPDGARVVLLSSALWRQSFAADPDVVGRTLEIDGEPHTVIGVMPPGFAFPSEATRAWVPLRIDRDNPWERNNHYLAVIGRLGDGVSLAAARAELALLSPQLNTEYPEYYDGGFALEVTGMLDSQVGDSRAALLTLFGAVVFVLLVACVNVANLLLARAESRRREIALRNALGGSRVAILRQLLVESLTLGTVGAAIGLALAAWGVQLLMRMAPDAIPRASEVGIDAGVLLFTLLVAVVVSVLFGLVPGLAAQGEGAQGVLKESGRSQSGSLRGRRSRAALVLLEVALAALLLVGGGAMMRSFLTLRTVDPGFDYRSVLTAQVELPQTEFDQPQQVVDFYQHVLETVGVLPGVQSAGAVARLPLARGVNNWSLQIEGQVVQNVADAPVAIIQEATPGYVEALGLRLLAGRFFTAADRADAPGVAVVSKSFADTYWPGESAVGKRVKVFLEEWPWLDVVGVVDDVHQYGLADEPEPTIYFAHAQAFQTAYFSPEGMHLVLRTAGDPAALVPAVREAVWSVNDAVPFGLVEPMDEVLAGSLARERFVVVLLGLFAGVALFLAIVGIAGVIAYSISERTREIGIRMALGARRGQILRLMVLPALGITVAGVAVGIAASSVFTGLLEGMLFEVGLIDPLTYSAVAAIFLAAALLACYLPARRAAGLDPAITLREE
ncbi:MAG: ABC transporter permease [Acidobacteriota bacterium]|jgi:predicted permease